MKAWKSWMFAVLVIGLGSCASSKVHTDTDPQANLSRYKTFRFTDTDDQAGPNPLYHSSILEDAIHREIAMELEKRGIDEDRHNPAMLIAYHTYTEKKQSSINNYYPMMYGGWAWRMYPWGFAPYPWGYWDGYQRNYEYTEGTLIIDAIDAKTNKLIWRGSISDVINGPADVNRKAIKAVRLIFDKFPIHPQPRKGDDVEQVKPITRNK